MEYLFVTLRSWGVNPVPVLSPVSRISVLSLVIMSGLGFGQFFLRKIIFIVKMNFTLLKIYHTESVQYLSFWLQLFEISNLINWVGTIANRYSAVWSNSAVRFGHLVVYFHRPVFIYSAVQFRPSWPVSTNLIEIHNKGRWNFGSKLVRKLPM